MATIRWLEEMEFISMALRYIIFQNDRPEEGIKCSNEAEHSFDAMRKCTVDKVGRISWQRPFYLFASRCDRKMASFVNKLSPIS